jgi:hypothetical protein
MSPRSSIVTETGPPYGVSFLGDFTPKNVLWELWNCLHQTYPWQFFVLGGRLVQVADGITEVVSKDRINGLVQQAIYQVTYQANGVVKERKPLTDSWVKKLWASTPEYCHPLRAVVNHPFLAPGARVVTAHGYDTESKVFLWCPDFGAAVNTLNPQVTAKDLAHFSALISDFALKTPADIVHALALLVSPFMRPGFDGPSPEFLVHADSMGSGKSTLCEVTGVLATGVVPPTVSVGDSASEGKYNLHGELAHPGEFIYTDNVKTASTWGDADRNRLLTAPGPVAVRPVGSSTVRVDPTTRTWMTTMNLYDIDLEHSRRTVSIALGATSGKYQFTDLVGHVRQHRLWFCLLLARCFQAWLDAGAPKPPRSLPSFDRWSDTVGGFVCWLWPDLAEHWLAPTARPIPAIDRELAELFEEWPRTGLMPPLGTTKPPEHIWKGSAEVLPLITGGDLIALQQVVGSGTFDSQKQRWGRFLRELADSMRVVLGYRLEIHRSGTVRTYRPVKVS